MGKGVLPYRGVANRIEKLNLLLSIAHTRKGRTIMQGFSSSFPRGSAGIGLLLLRAAVATQLLLAGGSTGWWLILAVALSLVLVLGVLTPVAALLATVFEAACLLRADGPHTAGLVTAAATALSLALQGAGGYSVDARWFGRRRLIVPAPPLDSD
jgi:hypothetical protein